MIGAFFIGKLLIYLLIVLLLLLVLSSLIRLENVVLITMAIFLSKLIYFNELALMIHPRYFWLVYVSVAIIALMILINRQAIKTSKNMRVYLVILSVFFIFGIKVDLRPLSSFAQGSLNVSDITSIDQLSRQKRDTNFNLDPESLKLEDWVTRFGIDPEPSKYVGQKVKVSGFYFKTADGSPMIARYVLSCCAADARIMGIWLTEDLQYKPNTWFELKGKLTEIKIGETRTVGIEVTSNKEIEAPLDPYVTN